MLNQKSINLIHSFEGCKLACYHLGDSVCTIGYGHTRPLNQCAGAGSWRISQAQADQFFNADIQLYENVVTSYFKRPLNENQIGALTSFCYNLGPAIFSNFSFNPIGSDTEITNHMMLFCNKGTPFEAGITRRRKAETGLFLDRSVTTNQNKIEYEVKPMFIATCPKTQKSFLIVAGAWSYITNDGMYNNIKRAFPNIPTLTMLEAEIKTAFRQNK